MSRLIARRGALAAAAQSSAALAYRDLVLATVPNLIHYWPMDNQAGEFEDQVGALDITDTYSTASVDAMTGVEGGSRSFANGGRATATAAVPANALVGCLFRHATGTADSSTGDALHGRWLASNGLLVFITNTGLLRGQFGALNIVGTDTVGTNWHLAMFSSGADGRRLYQDEVTAASSVSTSAHGTTGASVWEFASYANNNANSRLNGKLAHCWVANAQPGAALEADIAAALSLAA